MIGQTVSHYEIVRKIGAGGMGVVYEARDKKLPRSVALKFLPSHLIADENAKKRFVHEAHALSALDHPNISVIHEIDETPDGQLFIVMPYYDGQTLHDILEDGPLPVEQALDVIAQVARGLGKAHEKGVIHRDVKPGNVIMTGDGCAKILDFGLAKLAGRSKVTKAGLAVGTAAYMSPEQATDGDVDFRTDIWSLGVLLYELLTGRRPFRGQFDQAVIYSILNEDPQDVASSGVDVPAEIADVIKKALAKGPDERYQSTKEFLADLGIQPASAGRAEHVSAPEESRPPDDVSIVVIPFDDINPDEDNGHFSDGLTEEIITDLSQVESVRVISRNSAAMLKGTTKTVKAIGAELNVRYVLRGSIRMAGGNLRINVQLIDAANDSNVWAEKYTGTLDDIFDLPEKVSHSIADALQIKLSPKENARMGTRPIGDFQAYECYLRARQEVYLYSEEAFERSLKYLKAGLDIVGENALLYAGMAHVHFHLVNAGFKPLDYLIEAEKCVDKVLALEPYSPHGYRLFGLIAILRKRFQVAVTHLKRALDMDPNDADSMFWLIHVYMLGGKIEAASALVKKLLEIDPLTPLNRAGPGWIHFFQGRFALALGPIRKVYESDPSNPGLCYVYVQMLVYNGETGHAVELIDRLAADAPEHPMAMLCVLLKSALQGKWSKAKKTMTPELDAMARSDPAYSWFVAGCYALLERNDEALEWIENAVSTGFINYPFLAKHDRLLDNIRDDSRFKSLLERVKHEWERFAE